MERIHLWKGSDTIKLSMEDDISDDIIKLETIGGTVYVLSSSFKLYHGNIEKNTDGLLELRLVASDVRAVDVTCDSNFLYVIEKSGCVAKYSKDLKNRREIALGSEQRCCSHGHKESRTGPKIISISASDHAQLFLTDDGQLWAAGNMPQIGIDTVEPKRVSFFDGKIVCESVVGEDFAVAVVRKPAKFPADDSDGFSEDVFVASCPRCASNISSSASRTSISGKSDVSSDSDAGRCNGPYGHSTSTDTSDSSKRIIDRLTVPEPYENGATTSESTDSELIEKKNIIFRNTEAAREFLTRQFSWMSAGEEYLVECTEGPTKMIRQNVSNVANLVYEGVRTVGDKVATLSRHVSGGSDTNEPARPDTPVPNAFDDFTRSSSAGTSEKDMSDRIVPDRTGSIIRSGNATLQTEIWTWGGEKHGQLGSGDTIRRTRPVHITKLVGLGIRKIVCGNQHVVALTLDGRAFLWGRNNHGQATVDSTIDQSGPKQFDIGSTEDRIGDIACGSDRTMLYTYGSSLYLMGKSTDVNTRLICMKFDKRSHKNKIENRFVKNRVLSSGSISCFIEIESNSTFELHLVAEQKFLESCILVHSTIIRQFQKKSVTFISMEIDIYETLCRCYSDVLHFTAANVLSLIELIEGRSSEFEVPSIGNVAEHIAVYEAYLNALCDVISLGGFSHISRLVDIPSQVGNIFSEFLPSKKSRKNPESIVSTAFIHILSRLESYINVLRTCLTSNIEFRAQSTIESDNPIEKKLTESIAKWEHFLIEREKRLNEAEVTRRFWENSGKAIETLRCAERRLIRESKTYPITYLNGGRFSSHWFVLLTDLFVHVNGTSQTAHSLQTVWVEPLADTESLKNALSLLTPEESMTLYAALPQVKNEWLVALRDAIKLSLRKPNAPYPPIVRNAGYTFVKNGFFKDAKYNGRWLNGKMHGAGKLEWPDGKTYCGQFQNNQLNGYGRMDDPNIGIYEGQWKDNIQNGMGIMRYSSGDIYEGHFKDGFSHGHGVLKHGHFMAQAASVYVGEWAVGVKCGYGVMDDISKGEKYLGNWCDNKKNGGGLIVTLDGIYYEGEFSQDVMTGHGLMIFEDGTHYEGEFRAAGILNGKGVLTLNGGDRIEGSLSGTWNEGIKINNATLHIKTCSGSIENDKPASFGNLCIPPTEKWKAIYTQCYQSLGIVDGIEIDAAVMRRAWQNIAVSISNSRRLAGNHSIPDDLDTIPQFGNDSLTLENLKEIERYLSKAFGRPCHPLGILLSDVTSAYTATYGGVRVHPLLLSHAVAELRSITERIYAVVTLLFPALPPVGKEFVFENEDERESVSVNATSLLHPVLLPKIHSSLFILYALHNKNEDDAYWKRLTKWNKQPDATLTAFLGVDKKFRTRSTATSPEDTERELSVDTEIEYADAIDGLQQLKTTFSPFEKLLVIRETFRKMTAHAPEYAWTMDDLFPMFLFVVVRARILQLGSEIHFVEDFMEPSVQNGELGIMFTTLKACYYQILQEKISMSS